MMVYLPAVVTAAMASFAGKPARCAGRVTKTLSIALELVYFWVDFGTNDFLLFLFQTLLVVSRDFHFGSRLLGYYTPSRHPLIPPSCIFVSRVGSARVGA